MSYYFRNTHTHIHTTETFHEIKTVTEIDDQHIVTELFKV